MNKVILMGRLVRNPEIKGIGDGKQMARYTLAVDRRYKKEGEKSADFINCVAFGKSAEFAEKYLAKGVKICVTGEWRTGSYKKDDKTVYTNDCVVEQQEFAESKKTSEQNREEADSGGSSESTDANGFMDIPEGISDDELPFN